ncbi:hypothetical protein M0R45_011410 [Rubus argutus]|uniref:Uncharacterized protein n=1 Tax=Rubus argutus TaxID=59490 RepID=A0AAW1Y9Y3_RUBAR
MVLKLQNSASAKVVGINTETQMVGKPETEANCFKPKKGSIFPAKRRFVKTMVLDSIVRFVLSIFCSSETNPIALSQLKVPNAHKCNPNQILPNPNPNLNNDDDDDKFAMRRP